MRDAGLPGHVHHPWRPVHVTRPSAFNPSRRPCVHRRYCHRPRAASPQRLDKIRTGIAAVSCISAHCPSGASDPAEIVTRTSRPAEVKAAASAVYGAARVEDDTERTLDGELSKPAVVLKDAPDSRAAKDTIDDLRTAVHRVLGVLILVALGIDHNIFLMHRVQEETGRLGCIGVLLDTFLVHTVLVPVFALPGTGRDTSPGSVTGCDPYGTDTFQPALTPCLLTLWRRQRRPQNVCL
ncbi:hypothetical protein ADK35_37280 [Streptomyces viridochromogenes]|nr:hypothetical protein ADK35_37280 [Streptomyces viridochromogenes]KOG12262.1 hypothetical protein ADK36_35375 [Streptomyces viridochromogenes]